MTTTNKIALFGVMLAAIVSITVAIISKTDQAHTSTPMPTSQLQTAQPQSNPKPDTSTPPKPTSSFSVFRDAGFPAGDFWIWSGADWGLEKPRLIDAVFQAPDVPEGKSCFAVKGGSGAKNYVGWGLFLGQFENHVCIKSNTINLLQYSRLTFFVKTCIDLKIEIQQSNKDGQKSAPCFISDYGWKTIDSNRFVEISIPASAFRGVDLTQIFSPFMITGIGNNVEFYVDNIKWMP